MNSLSLSRIALKALFRNKIRSLLTMLGIIIGVGAVIAMVSLGEGARRQVQAEISSMGTNILYVRSGSFRSFGVHGGSGTIANLNEEDYLAIGRECSAVKLATPDLNTRAQVVFGNQNWNTQLEGVNEHFLEIRSWTLSAGENFSRYHVETAARVCILGKTVADTLFPGGDAVRQIIRVRNLPFQVLGVLAAKGENAWGRDQDDVILAPYMTLMKKLMQTRNISSILVSAISASTTFTAEEQIRELLRQRLRLGPEQEETFSIRNLSDLADTAEQTNRTMTMLLGSIAAVSLLVGGIGIMNIMLVAVTERTREIGLRMAVGAHPALVRIQFLLEAVVLCVIGGAIGIALGVGASFLISEVLGWAAAVSPGSVALSVVTAVGIGVFFGFYPAHKASNLDPIEALRHE